MNARIARHDLKDALWTLRGRFGDGKYYVVSEMDTRTNRKGDIWGYSTHPGDAIQVSTYWKNRFLSENVPGRQATPLPLKKNPTGGGRNPPFPYAKNPRKRKTRTKAIAPRTRDIPKRKTWTVKNRNIRRMAHENVQAATKAGFTGGYFVQVKRGEKWVSLGRFAIKAIAIDYGKSLANKYRTKQFRVFW